MKATNYAAFSLILFASSLAACSSEQSAQSPAATVAAPATPAAATAGQAPPAAPGQPTVKPTAKATVPPVAAATAAPAARARQGGAGAVAPTGQPASAPHPPRWVSRARLAASPAGTTAPATGVGPEASALTAGPAPASAAPTDSNLSDYLTQAAPVAQVFEVRTGRDTLLLGAQGTRLIIPADAFEVPAGSGPVRLQLREFYSTPDIVLAGLGTRAGLDVLETGGMLHLYAAASGQTVHLRPGKQLLLQLPTRQQLPGMRLYEGVSADVAHAPDWQLAGTGAALGPAISASNPLADRAALDEWVKLHPPKSPRWPEFAKGEKGLLKEVERLLPNAKADQAYLRRKRTVGKAEQQMLKELSRENHTPIRHAVIVAVQLDSAGQLQAANPLVGDSLLSGKVLAALRQLPAQRPASFVSTLPRGRRTSSAAQGFFSVLYTRSGKQLVGFQWLVMDKQLREELGKVAQSSRAAFAKGFASASTPLALDSGLYYELAAGGLGWINCDRLLQPGPRVLFTVQTPDPGTVVSLVFKGQRSILASSRTEGRAALFEQVPDGAAATVVALRRDKGITYLATSSVSLGATPAPALDFRPVSLEQLRTELAQL